MKPQIWDVEFREISWSLEPLADHRRHETRPEVARRVPASLGDGRVQPKVARHNAPNHERSELREGREDGRGAVAGRVVDYGRVGCGEGRAVWHKMCGARACGRVV